MKASVLNLMSAVVVAVGLFALTGTANALTVVPKPNSKTFDYTFSFINHYGFGGKLVKGIVRGLKEGQSTATSVEITSNSKGIPDAFGVGEYIGNPKRNIWVVENGKLVEVDFLALGKDNTHPALSCCSLRLIVSDSLEERTAVLSHSPSKIEKQVGNPNLKFAALNQPTPVPLPAAGWLLAAGLAGVAGLQLRKKQGARA